MSAYLAWSDQPDRTAGRQANPVGHRVATLTIVQPGDISAAARRRRFARSALAARDRAQLRGWAAVGSVIALFGSAAAAMIWAFWTIPNTPLP